jgi:hypothetical protein
MPEREIIIVTVIGSNVVARADGRVAMALQTKEQGAIAFEVTLETIPVIRRELALAEQMLRAPTGHA